MRLRVDTFNGQVIHLRGKGRDGGKPRTIKVHPETRCYLADFLTFRERLVREALEEAHLRRYNRSRRIREEIRAKTLSRPNQTSERETG